MHRSSVRWCADLHRFVPDKKVKQRGHLTPFGAFGHTLSIHAMMVSSPAEGAEVEGASAAVGGDSPGAPGVAATRCSPSASSRALSMVERGETVTHFTLLA